LQNQAHWDFRYSKILFARLSPFQRKEATEKAAAKKEAAEKEVAEMEGAKNPMARVIFIMS
jgi:hypothetical protein